MSVDDTRPRRPARRRAGTDRATRADVAREAGVSAQTVSRALRAPATVSPETRRQIEAAIRKTSYVQNLAASHLASNRSMTVAAIIPTISASVFAETIEGLSEALLAQGYQLFLGDAQYRLDREEGLIRSFLGRRPDGFFLVGTRHSRAAAALLRQAGMPIVESWEWTPRPIDMLVGFDNRAAMAALVDHLVARGRRRLVFSAVVRPGDPRVAQRRDGFVEAVGRHFPGEAPRLAVVADLPVSLASGPELLALARREHPDADAVLFATDLLAAGALLHAARLGVRVPEDIAVTGFGDFEIARELTPALTTIAVPTRAIGARAAALLLAAIAGERQAERRVDVGFTLVARQSG